MKLERGVEVVTAAVVHNAKGEILLVRSTKWGDRILFPGGHVEPGETIFDSARREAEEEVGLTVVPKACLQVGELINSPKFHRPAHLVFFHILCEAKTTELTLDPREIAEAHWYTPEVALGMELFPSTRTSIENFVQGIMVPIVN